MAQILNFGGSGIDGDLNLVSNTVDAPIDSPATASSGSNTISATNPLFQIGQLVEIHQTQGTGANTFERAVITDYIPGTVTVDRNLTNNYIAGAQLIVVKQYRSITVNAGITWSAKPWNGSTGGYLLATYSGFLNNYGTISADGKGFRGGVAPIDHSIGNGGRGENINSYETTPSSDNTTAKTAVANGGGAGTKGDNTAFEGGGGGGGGNGSAGTAGQGSFIGGRGGAGGATTGNATLTEAGLGGGGGASGDNKDGQKGVAGGRGGGRISLHGRKFNNYGTISSNGENGLSAGSGFHSGSGGGSGGDIDIKAEIVIGANGIAARGGTGGTGNNQSNGGNGGDGRIRIEAGSISGDSTPAASEQIGNLFWLSEVLYASELTTTSTSTTTSTTTTSSSTTTTSTSTTTTSSSTTTTSTTTTSSSTTTTSSSTTTTSSSTTTTSTTTTVPYSISVDAG